MKFPKLTTLHVVLTIFLCFFIQKAQPQEYDLNTSMNSYWPAPDLNKPGYLEEVTDPVFNSKITRITGAPGSTIPNTGGETWRDIARHSYSIKQPWNADESILFLNRHKDLNGNWGSSLFLDGETYEVISSANVMPSYIESRWHPTNPNLRILLTSNSFQSWNFHTGEVITLITFNGYSNVQLGPWTGNLSDDGSMAAVYATRNSDGKKVGFAVDIDNNIKYPDIDYSSINNLDYLSISPLGNYILVNADFGQGGDRTKIYDLNGNQVGPYWSEYGRPSHYDMIADADGNEYAVGVDKSNHNSGRVIKRKLSDGSVVPLTTGGWVSHTSARSLNRPGWVFASTSESTSWQPYLVEVIAVKLDGSRVERVAHTRNVFSNYENQSQPSPSPSGSRVIFASDWGNGSTPVQAYIADYRDLGQSAGFTINAGADQNICENATEDVTLTASSGAQSYTWTWDGGQQNGQSITISPPSETTIYTVTGSDASGNEATDTVTVTVNQIIEADAGGDVEICEGNSVSLSASDGDSFEWNNGETTQSIVVSPEQTITYTVTVTQNGCSSSDDVTVTVKPRPVINAGNDVDIYIGESTILTAVGDGTFEWNTGETTESITVSPTETTTYTVTNTFNGCSNSDQVVVNIYGASAGNDVTICPGEDTTLSASVDGGQAPYTYVWSNGESGETITVSPTDTTTYSVTITDSQSSVSTAEVTVSVSTDSCPPSICASESGVLIDGTQDASWENSFQDVLDLEIAGEVSSPADLSATFNITWDEANLYIVANVIDDIKINDSGESWEDDGLELFIDGNNDKQTTYDANDRHYIFRWNDNTVYEYGNNQGINPTGVSMAQTQTNNGYTMEISVAWSALGVSAYDNKEVGFDLQVNDDDNGGTDLEARNAWFANSSAYLDPSIIGTIKLDNSTCNNNSTALSVGVGENVEICEGLDTTLTASASGGQAPYTYLWSTGEDTESITISPNINTTYTVIVTDGLSNTTTNSVDIMVSEAPIANAGEDADIFYGESATLTASGGTEYLWGNGETTQSIVVSPTDDKDYVVEVFDNGCSSSDTVSVHVDVKATTSENVTICQGEFANLSASGGSSYLWSNGATNQSIEVNPNQTTTYSVVVSHGELSDEASVEVNVNLLPIADAGEDVMIEAGQNVTLSAAGGNSYIWSTGDTAQNISVSPTETTTYMVETIINGCSNFDEVIVTVVPVVDADAGDNVNSCQGETVILTASGGEYFEWNTGETTASITVSPFETTTYSVTVSNGISNQTVSVTVITEDCIAMENPDDEYIAFDYLVYPNPSTGEVKIKLSGLDNISTIYITDILGKLIKTDLINPNGGLVINKSYNLSSLSKGMYFVTFEQSGEEAITKKLILK